MTFDDIKEMQIGSKKVKEAWLNGRQVYPSEKRIMDSLVCWYDIGKQQCTNESMAANPVLADLSGNGHDITCYNFGWAGMSGIGGYVFSSPLASWYKSSKNNGSYTTEGNVLHITKLNTNSGSYYVTNNGTKTNTILEITGNNYTTKPFKIKISGLPEGKLVRLGGLIANNTVSPTINVLYENKYFGNGEHIVESSSVVWENEELEVKVVNYPSIYIDSDTADDVDITIELLPEYPNALVSDGVDDYYQTLPTYPKEVGTCFLTAQSLKGDSTSYIIYMSEAKEESGRINSWIGTTVGAGGLNKIMLRGVNEEDREISVLSSSSLSGKGTLVFTWNNNIPLMVGRINDERVELDLEQLHTKYSFGTDFNDGNIRRKMVFYSFLLFDRDLTEQEIEWVKKNMVEGDLVLPSYELDPSLIDAWIFSGLRNEDAPASIVGEKGIELYCHNFAWNKEGSGFKDGALCFDGADDYCVAQNKLACDRNVTVIGKRRLTSAEYNLWQTSLNIHIGNSLPNILYLDYYPHTAESVNGHKLKCVFGDYEYYYDNDTEPHSFWATKDAFNGQAYNKVGNFENGLKYDYSIYLGRVWSGVVAQCEWYYFAIYDKVMTEKEAQAETKKLEKIWSNRKNN